MRLDMPSLAAISSIFTALIPLLENSAIAVDSNFPRSSFLYSVSSVILCISKRFRGKDTKKTKNPHDFIGFLLSLLQSYKDKIGNIL